MQGETQEVGKNFSDPSLNVNNILQVFHNPEFFDFLKSLMTKQTTPQILSSQTSGKSWSNTTQKVVLLQFNNRSSNGDQNIVIVSHKDDSSDETEY